MLVIIVFLLWGVNLSFRRRATFTLPQYSFENHIRFSDHWGRPSRKAMFCLFFLRLCLFFCDLKNYLLRMLRIFTLPDVIRFLEICERALSTARPLALYAAFLSFRFCSNMSTCLFFLRYPMSLKFQHPHYSSILLTSNFDACLCVQFRHHRHRSPVPSRDVASLTM